MRQTGRGRWPSIPGMPQYQSTTSPQVGRTPKWLWILPVISCGFLSLVPVIVIAAKLKQRQAWQLAGGLTVAWFVGFGLIGTGPDDVDTWQDNVGVVLYLGTLVASIVYVLIMAPKVAWSGGANPPPPPPPVAPVYDPNSAAVEEIHKGRRKRSAAREMAERDPQMARELRVGRPDLARQYDDGGLVDVNHVPEATLIKVLGLSPEKAAHVVEVRQQLGKFEHIDDLVNLAGMELSTYDQVKDRIILL